MTANDQAPTSISVSHSVDNPGLRLRWGIYRYNVRSKDLRCKGLRRT